MGKKKKITQHDYRIGYWASGSKGVGRFQPLTTFGLRLLKHVKAPEDLPNDAGFVVEVAEKRKDEIKRG